MANTIRLKRASGSDPSASDLVTGELAVRTDTAKLFTKKDDNSVAEIGASVGTDDVNTAAIQDDAVTYAKIQNVSATNRILGRDSSGAGNIEEITPANLRTMINVENGATADQTASEILTALLTVDGTSSGLVAQSAGFVDVSGVTTNSDFQVIFSTNNDGSARTIACDSTDNKFTYNPSSNTLTVDTVVAALTGNASTATKLATARTIAGVSFDGSANISLNNNAITNGAGYITATLTNEQVQDIVGAMVSGNTESGITVNYQDSDGTLDFIVASQTDNNFTNADHSKLDGIEAGATADQSASEILTLLKTVDGSGSGLDADNLDGRTWSTSAGNSTIVSRNGSGYIFGNFLNMTGTFSNTGNTSGMATFTGTNGSDNYGRSYTAAAARALLNVENGATADQSASEILTLIKTVDGAGSGLAADVVDGLHASSFLRSDTNDTSSSKITFSGGAAMNTTCTSSINTLSDGSTITPSFTGSIHHAVTLGGNRTLSHGNTSSAIGQCGSIFIAQDGTGSRTLSFNSAYKFAGGTAPTLSTAANAVDRIDYVIRASSVIHCAFTADVK